MTRLGEPYDWDTALKLTNQRNKLFSALTQENNSYNIGYWDHKDIKGILNAYPDDLIRRIDGFVSAAEDKPETERRIDAIRLFIVGKDTRERINEVIHFLPLFPAQVTELTVKDMITALNHYQQLPRSSDYSREDPVVVSQCHALLYVSCSLLHLYNLEDSELKLDMLFNKDSTIADQHLVELVLANPDHGETIRDFIIQRGSVNVGLIGEMLTLETSALNNGVL